METITSKVKNNNSKAKFGGHKEGEKVMRIFLISPKILNYHYC